MADPRPLALVTGGARRVGRAIALALARRGCDIVATYRESDAEAQSLRADILNLGVNASVERLDVSDLRDVRAYAARFTKAHARLDVLVHNASVYHPTTLEGLAAGEPAADPEAILRVNAVAPLILTAGLRGLLQASALPGGGAVVAMCDIHAMGRPRRDHAPYLMSKAALAAMVESLAMDLAPRVRVTGVAPGVVAWPESGDETDPAMQARYLARIPLARPGTPDDAASVVAWLALDATYLTGQIIRVDGGRWLG